ncbi:MAG: NAD(P)H-dependent oxidoreductase, partial [Rhodocyclaceae bacterium]|nr:NAD(P)H-dependent oxidoreductase [Rhodocyclaceae bacterium]
MMRKPAILVFAGSIRSGAYSQQTADAYAAQLAGMECEVTRITLADYPLPIMDEDLEEEKG